MPGNNHDPIDSHIDNRVRLKRTQLGMSQEQLADALELTVEQIEQIEHGARRLAPAELHTLATVLQVGSPFYFFYEAPHSRSED